MPPHSDTPIFVIQYEKSQGLWVDILLVVQFTTMENRLNFSIVCKRFKKFQLKRINESILRCQYQMNINVKLT
jgi:hypothetical protein